MTVKTETTYANAAAFLKVESATALDANFRMLATGTVMYLAGAVWSPANDRTPTGEIADTIRVALGEPTAKDTKDAKDAGRAGKSKRYAFAALALTIARDFAKGNEWSAELRDHSRDSLESAVAFLAARFASIAPSVAALADMFATAKKAKAKGAKSLLDVIEGWLTKDESGDAIPLASIVDLLLPCGVSTADMVDSIGRMTSKLNDAQIGNLLSNLNDVLASRRRRAAVARDAAAAAADAAAASDERDMVREAA